MEKKKKAANPTSDDSESNLWSFLTPRGTTASFVCITLFAILVRVAVSIHPYSGAGTPPKYGDYEAQRHWMEITLNLPVKEWYRNSTVNDLKYWGLDYPPLTAYQSYIHGLFLRFFDPQSVALFTSRGYESYIGKLLMRWTVLLSDVLIFFPAVIYFVTVYYSGTHDGPKSGNMWHFAMILLNPCLILIDHGHFQYNCISLGFTVAAVSAILSDRDIFGSILFTLSLNHKQMSAYFAPAFFGYLFGKCLRRQNPFLEVLKLGLAVLGTFIVLWWPYLYSLEAPLEVLSRLAPFERGIYEDYVANFWCTTSVIVKWKRLFSTQALRILSLVSTVSTCLPSMMLLILAPSRKNFLFGLLSSALSFYFFSFQVHEKSILLPLLPASFLAIDEPLIFRWLTYFALLSLFPLLRRDELILPYIALYGLFVLLYNAPVQRKDIRETRSHFTTLKYFLITSSLLLHIVYLMVTPPRRYPYLFEAVMMLLCFSQFFFIFMYANMKQWEFLKLSSQIVREKKNLSAGAGSVKSEEPLHTPSHGAGKSPRVSVGTRDTLGQTMPNSSNSSTSLSSPPSSGAYFSASDPVLLPSHDLRPPGAVGTIRREVGGQHVSSDHVPTNSIGSKATTVSDSRNSTPQVKMSSKFQGPGKNQLPDFSQCASSAQGVSSLSRPSSNYNNRPLVGPQKAGPGKEWKPKPTHNNIAQGKAISASSADLSTVSAEVDTQPQPTSVSVESKEGTSELQQKLEKSHISEIQHVVIPNHLHVPEAEKLGFCFGSFEASLGLGVSPYNAAEKEKTPSLSGSSEDIEETENEHFSSDQNPPTTADFSDQSPPSSGQENLSAKPEDVSPSVPEYSESKQETLQGGHQYSAVRTSPNYSFGFMLPPTLGSQLAPFENSESQSHDVSRLPNFVVQQPIDPTNYYAQFYRSSADGDGRISPFQSAGVSTKYNGNVAVVAPQTSQSAQEGGNTLVLSTAAPTALATQAAGLMQSSAAVTQQPLPVFRQAAGMHLPHYPPNYIPYAHYFSPYYVPPTAIHQFLSNGAFPQQPQAGGVYPPPPSAAAGRYSLSQYRPGANVGNSTHSGVPGSYGPYGSSTANYNPSSTTAAGNPASNDDLSAAQFKENNVHVNGQQQSEGSGVWITPGRDLSSLQASSFYNLPQGQVAFTPAQPGHGNLAGLYHPAQPVTAQTVHSLMQQSQMMAGPDMVGPTATVYQQPQHSQINWPSSY